MHRPLVIVGAFLVITLGLILFQPGREAPQIADAPSVSAPPDPATTETARAPITLRPLLEEETAPSEDVADVPQIPVEATATPTTELAAIRPIARPTPAPELAPDPANDLAGLTTPPPADVPTAPAVVEPVAATEEIADVEEPITVLSLQALASEAATTTDAEPGDDALLFSQLAADRPRLLTITRRDESGQLSPSSANSVSQLSSNRQTRTPPSPIITLIKPADSSAAANTVAASTAPAEEDGNTALPLDAVTDVAATLPRVPEIGNADLRAKLINAPTRAVHTVRLGDSLLTLALRYYGDGEQAEMILEANRRHLGEEGELKIGQILRIPDIDDL